MNPTTRHLNDHGQRGAGKSRRWFRGFGLPIMLIAVLASLVPTRPATARPSYVDGTTAVKASATKVRDIVWVANGMQRITSAKRSELAAFALVLQQLYRENPLLAPSTATLKIQALQNAYNSSTRADQSPNARTANESLFAVFAVLTASPISSSPAGSAVTRAARQAFALTLGKPAAGESFGDDRIAAATELQNAPFDDALRTILADSVILERQNSRFRLAFDQLFATDFGVGINASTAAIIQSSPVLQAMPEIPQLIRSDGTVQTTVGDLKALLQQHFAALDTVLTDARTLLATLDAQQSDLVTYAQNSAARDAAKTAAEQAAKEAQAEIDKAKAAFDLLSKLMGLVDPQASKLFSTVGSAMIKIAEAVNNYTKAVAGLGTLDALASFSSVALTGNIIGAVMTIFSLFGSGPTPEQMIMAEIGKLRQQVEQLRTEMHGRFDRIDLGLNVIYQTLVDRFNQIDLALGRLNGDVHEVQSALVEIEKSIHRFEKNMFDILSDGFRRPLWDEINGCIGYRERTGAVMPFQPEYVDCENAFQTWATIHAFDQVATGPTGRPLDDDHVYDELSKYPLDTNINYVGQFVSQRFGLASFAPTKLANPRDWAIAGRAYAELATDWPAYARRISAGRAAAIDNAGVALQKALRTISTVDTTTGPRADRQYFDVTIANYKEKATGLDAAIQGEEATLLDDLRRADPATSTDDRHGLLNLWGGSNQALDPADLPALPRMPGCGGSLPLLVSPSNLVALWFPAPFPVARYLGLGSVTICYSAGFVEERSVFTGSFANRIETIYGKLLVGITAKYNGTTIRTRSIKLPEGKIGSCQGDNGDDCTMTDPAVYTRNNWTSGINLKAKFETASTLAFNNAALATQTTATVADRLHVLQRSLYQEVIREFNSTGLLATAALRLTGAKAVLDALVMLGLPRAVESDEFLHALIFGNQRLLDQDDEQRLTLLYAVAWNTLPSHNPRTDIVTAMNGRSDALRDSLSAYLDEIDAGSYAESHRLVVTTLDRSRIAQMLARTPLAGLSATRINLGSQAVGTTGNPQSVTLSSVGVAAPLGQIAISLTGTNAADFVMTTNCGTTLVAGASCTIEVALRPTAAGTRAATLAIVSNAPGSPHRVTLTGTGTQP